MGGSDNDAGSSNTVTSPEGTLWVLQLAQARGDFCMWNPRPVAVGGAEATYYSGFILVVLRETSAGGEGCAWA